MQIGSSLQVLRSVNPHLSTPVEVTHQRTHCKLVFHRDFMQNIKAWQKAKNCKPCSSPLEEEEIYSGCVLLFSQICGKLHTFFSVSPCLSKYRSPNQLLNIFLRKGIICRMHCDAKTPETEFYYGHKITVEQKQK